MSVANQLYGVKNAANVCLFGAESGELAVDLDYANSLELDLKEDGIQYAMRDGSKKAIKFDGEVVGTLKIGVDMVNSDLLAFINRSKLLKGLRDIFKNETVKVTEDDQTCTFENEVKGILGVYKVKKDGTKISKLSDASCAGKNVTLTGAKAGDIVKVYYTSEKEVTTFKIKGTKEVQEDYIGYADVLGKAYEGGESMPFQYKFYKVSPQASINLKYDGANVSKFELNFDLLCDSDDNIVDYFDLSDSEPEEVIPEVPETLVVVAGTNEAHLGFSAPKNATKVELEYSDDHGVTWKKVSVGSTGSVIEINADLTKDSKSCVVKNLTTGDYKFRLLINDKLTSAESDEINIA